MSLLCTQQVSAGCKWLHVCSSNVTMRVVLSLCSYKHVFNGLRRVAMEGNDRDEFIDMTVSNG